MKSAAAVLLVLVLLAGATPAQPDKGDQAQQLLALAQEVQAQQKQIAENQAKIEARLATIAEAVRQARIYASRGGAK